MGAASKQATRVQGESLTRHSTKMGRCVILSLSAGFAVVFFVADDTTFRLNSFTLFSRRFLLTSWRRFRCLLQWPKPDDKATKATPPPTNAEKALAEDLAATAAEAAAAAEAAEAASATVAASSSSTFSSGQRRKTRNEDAAEPAKRPRAQKPPPSGGQPATVAAPGSSAAFQRPESRGHGGMEQLSLLAGASAPALDGMLLPPPPPPQLVAAAAPGARASAAPASSAMDLDFLADAAASATPTSGALGGHPAGGLHESPVAAVGGLRGSQAPLAQAPAGTCTQGIDGGSTAGAAATASPGAADGDNDTLLPWSPWSQEDFSVRGFGTGTDGGAAAAAASATAEAGVGAGAGAAGATAAGASGGASMPPFSARPTSASLDDINIDMAAGIGPGPLEDGGETEEDRFLASLVNSIDPANPKTLRVRGAMLSRLKNIGRATVA